MTNLRDRANQFSRAVADGTVDTWFDDWVIAVGEHHAYKKIVEEGPARVPDEPGLYLWGADRTVDGQKRIVPRYVGKDNKSLRSRFLSRKGHWSGGRGRYVLPAKVLPGATPPQGWLAFHFQAEIRDVLGDTSNDEYMNTLKPWSVPRSLRTDALRSSPSPAVRGLLAFPRSLVDAFRTVEGGHPKLLRLRHAVDWASHGGPNLLYLWAAFLPGVAHLEGELRSAAIRWRSDRGLPPLLNSQDRPSSPA